MKESKILILALPPSLSLSLPTLSTTSSQFIYSATIY